ncbi:Na+/H+ antiporter subunit G [Chryseomicrobium excrementi]|uniref:Na+/H+ antiporter subunit G n=1 Tax=Chryseomicrobium excrementi TaxID=2041346 RepID=A0A2M9F1B8_9BACL|nr:monovalent cation/H(+) antiporter subunit G [Chryseomicrobium excrementi]PJK17250.1 Na+/H+ antiporter subunit G [Chryseomicrobium excrementi]
MTEILINSLIILFIAVGVFFILVTAIGLIRLPDVYSRAHAASKSATLGVMSILIGVFLHFWLIEGNFNPRIILGIVFLFITGPVGGHMMAKAAYFSGVPLAKETVRDDMAPLVDREATKKEQL